MVHKCWCCAPGLRTSGCLEGHVCPVLPNNQSRFQNQKGDWGIRPHEDQTAKSPPGIGFINMKCNLDLSFINFLKSLILLKNKIQQLHIFWSPVFLRNAEVRTLITKKACLIAADLCLFMIKFLCNLFLYN